MIIYEPPPARGHRCGPEYGCRPDRGTVWRCGCGAYWRYEPVPLMTFCDWYRLRGLKLWWWKRRHPASAVTRKE